MLEIKNIMEERGLTESDVAKTSGVHRVIVSRITSGKLYPSRKNAQRIAKALDWRGDLRGLFAEAEVR